MAKLLPAEKLFSENVDRLISGQEIKDVPETDRDLQSALDFARLIRYRQPQPSPQFQAALKARLLFKLEQQESEVRPNWFQRLLPRQPVWQAVTAVVAILIIGGAVLGIIRGNQSTQPVINAPTPLITTTATSTTYATSTTTAAATSAPWAGLQSVRLSAEGGTDKAVYRTGEEVFIEVKLKNNGSQPLVLAQFPPILSLMSEVGQPVLTFKAGQSGRTLLSGETVSFFQYWDQKDARQNSVTPGRYHLELEDIDFYGEAYQLELSRPVSFEIVP